MTSHTRLLRFVYMVVFGGVVLHFNSPEGRGLAKGPSKSILASWVA